MEKRLTYHALLFTAGFVKICCCIAYFIFVTAGILNAQQRSSSESKIKAAFLANFTRFVYWPPSAFSSQEEPFVIGIVGSDPFGRYLDDVLKRGRVNERPIVIRRYRALDELQKAHILYINLMDASQIKEILSKVDPLHTLTVSDHENFASSGGEVVFFKENSRIRIGINTEAVKRSSLEISSKLLSISKDMSHKKLE